MLRALLRAGASVQLVNNKNKTALCLAAQVRRFPEEVFRLLEARHEECEGDLLELRAMLKNFDSLEDQQILLEGDLKGISEKLVQFEAGVKSLEKTAETNKG